MLQTTFRRFGWMVLLAMLAAGGSINTTPKVNAAKPPALREVFKKDFLIGAALNQNQFTEGDERGVKIITSQFSSITPENILKWESVHPLPGSYKFDGPDAYVAFGEKYHMFVIGH